MLTPFPPAVSAALLAWYDRGHRELPWRGIHNAYATWVSETMLQQTRVETVIPYYLRFMVNFPTVAALAEATEDSVLKHWEGLGYYSRARNLRLGAQQVMAEFGGQLPHTAEALRGIRGIGPYTAGAIASIAFDQPVPALDGNVQRVTCRLCGLRQSLATAQGKALVQEAAAALVPPDRPGDFNQAEMDLGATVCVPGTPDCPACPLRELCVACRDGDAELLPVLPRKKPPVPVALDVLLISSGNRLLMRQRTESLLCGLWVPPMVEQRASLPDRLIEAERLVGLPLRYQAELGTARHVFTHRVWQMTIHHALALTDQPRAPYVFVSPEGLRTLSLPTATRAAMAAWAQILSAAKDGKSGRETVILSQVTEKSKT